MTISEIKNTLLRRTITVGTGITIMAVCIVLWIVLWIGVTIHAFCAAFLSTSIEAGLSFATNTRTLARSIKDTWVGQEAIK